MDTTYSMFGFIDLVVCGCGVYGLYSWYMLVKKHKILKTFLLGADTNPEQCKDLDGFATFMGPKIMILSIVLLAFGGLSAYNSYVQPVGAIVWVGMAIFFVVIIWYCVQLKKADGIYFDKGKRIKEKALKK